MIGGVWYVLIGRKKMRPDYDFYAPQAITTVIIESNTKFPFGLLQGVMHSLWFRLLSRFR